MKKRIENSVAPVCPSISRYSRSAWLLTSLVILALFSEAAQAQFIRFRASPVGVTVPLNTTKSFVITNLVNVSALSNSYTTLSISGLPTGATATLTDTNLLPLGTITNNTAVWLNLTANNVAEGLYTFNINGSGVDTNGGNPVSGVLFLRLQVGYVWNGTPNAGLNGPGNWSDSTQWLGSVAGSKPGDAPGHDVIFTDLGGQTNTSIIVTGVSTNLLTNSVIDVDTTVASLRFAQTNNPTGNTNAVHNLAILPGKTLSITGTNGFSFLRDYISEFAGIGTRMSVTITGTNGTMVVTNPQANFSVMVDNQNATLDMSGLGTFRANVNRFALGDYSAWPNYLNLQTNNYPSQEPRKFLPIVTFARTNLITATYSDPNNYTNASSRDYSVAGPGSGVSGSTTANSFRLGVTNAFFVDSMCFAHGGQQINFLFNTTSNNFAYFRGTNGGRMAMFALADQGGDNTNLVTSNCKATVDFTGGTVDMLVDRLYMSRDRVLMGQAQPLSSLTLSRGIINANEMILGYQEHPGQTNGQTYCQGTLTVTNTATVKINGNLVLGYMTETNVGSNPGQVPLADAIQNFGHLNIGPGGTVMANTILVGGPQKLSVNTISVVNGGTLIISNTLADPLKALDTLTINGGSTNVLHVDCNNTTTPLEYVNQLTMAGTDFIKIGVVQNLAAVEVPLIFYTNGSATFAGQAIMPPPPPGVTALNGVLRKDETVVPHVLYLDILTNAPKNLAWRGPGTSANWNATSKNWADLNNGGVLTNFVNGDNVTFDDTPGLAATVVITDVGMIPGSITMTNSTYNYVFSAGGGTLEGTALLNKWGSNPLEIDAPTTVSVVVNQGSLVGSTLNLGTVGPVTIAAGSTMSYPGNIVGGIGCAGTAVVAGSVVGDVALSGGTGTLTNMGSIVGVVSLGTNTTFVNGGSINFTNLGTCNLASNSLFINVGNILGDNISVNGTFKDNGTGIITLRDTIDFNSGSLFLPGGGSPNQMTTFQPKGDPTHTNAARVTFHNRSTVVFATDPSTASATQVLSGKQSFGDNPSGQTPGQFGCTLIVSNATGAPYVAGQVYTLCQYAFGGAIIGTGISTNAYPIINPNEPANNLAWDISQMTKVGTLGVFGISTTPVTLGKTFTIGTNAVLVGTNVIVTNTLVTHLTWPSDHTGYAVWQQSNPDTIGLGTNWTPVFYSFTNNEFYITNITTTMPDTMFFRLQYPPFPQQSQ